MNRRILLPTLVLAALAASSCLPFLFRPVSPDPTITTDRDKHDFGTIPGTEVVETKFKVRNVGGKTLEISRVQTSCGCTSSVIGSQSLKPGASCELSVKYDPRGRSGRQARTIWLFSNDPKTPQKQLVIISDVPSLSPAQDPQILITPTSATPSISGSSGETSKPITIPQPELTPGTPPPAGH